MSQIRKVERSWKSIATVEGAGVHLKRAFGFQESQILDPFLLLNDFHSRNPTGYLPGFPWHPKLTSSYRQRTDLCDDRKTNSERP